MCFSTALIHCLSVRVCIVEVSTALTDSRVHKYSLVLANPRYLAWLYTRNCIKAILSLSLSRGGSGALSLSLFLSRGGSGALFLSLSLSQEKEVQGHTASLFISPERKREREGGSGPPSLVTQEGTQCKQKICAVAARLHPLMVLAPGEVPPAAGSGALSLSLSFMCLCVCVCTTVYVLVCVCTIDYVCVCVIYNNYCKDPFFYVIALALPLPTYLSSLPLPLQACLVSTPPSTRQV